MKKVTLYIAILLLIAGLGSADNVSFMSSNMSAEFHELCTGSQQLITGIIHPGN